ncbi:hypothetical protein MUK42_16679 [Musa troglodytarum]|uniref:Protein DA1-like domain-containing protein n=1 Tax=Musa troglodytarum TaxID=320322 RepID=A0A9E7I0Z2_9LILI|nr:hypothetical protein MUK42_16679 [Musa troglodytarum]
MCILNCGKLFEMPHRWAAAPVLCSTPLPSFPTSPPLYAPSFSHPVPSESILFPPFLLVVESRHRFRPPQWPLPTPATTPSLASKDDQSKGENEDLDHAIALSLAEDAKKPIGYKGQGNDDDELAKAIRESLSMPSSQPYQPVQFLPRGYRICGVCHNEIGEGRSLCLECLDSAVMDAGDCQALYHSIRDYYEGLYMRIDQQIPMLLVERQALNEAMEGEKDGHHHKPEIRGLCLTEERTISSDFVKAELDAHGSHFVKILLLTGSILAHELMHGWLRLKGYRNLSAEVEEGICQALSHMWLESEVMPGSTSMPSSSNYASSSSSSSSSSSWMPLSKKAGKSDIEKKLGQFFMYQIAHDTSTAYGEGFRAANAAVNKYGLPRTLDHIRLTRSFPI